MKLEQQAASSSADKEALDESWYVASYISAREEIALGRARDACDHYQRFGRYRGYLPSSSAERLEQPSAFRSRFGGLWTDLFNAHDLVDGKLALGWLTDQEAVHLRHWIDNGFVVLPNAAPEDLVEAARADLQRAFDGKIPGQNFVVENMEGNVPWGPYVDRSPAKARDIHQHSAAVRDVMFSEDIRRFLALLFERQALITQSLGFLRGSGQDAHQDSRVVGYTNPLQFAAAWIALEDVTAGAGELFYYVGSHRLPEYLYFGRYKNQHEAHRLEPGRDLTPEIEAHDHGLPERAKQAGLREETLLAKKGDVMIWSADLAHGGRPISHTATRRSVVAHYCPAEIAPLSFERRRRFVHRHRTGGRYVSDTAEPN